MKTKTFVYSIMHPFGIVKFELNMYDNILKHKINYLKSKGFNRDMIKGYLFAQGEKEIDIRQFL